MTHESALNVRVPKGVKRGQQIRLAGQGSQGMGGGGANGLYLEIEFKPHPFYRLERRDLYLELPVAPWETALGSKVKAPTPAGITDLKIPAGSTSGRKLRLKGRSIPGKPSGYFYAVLHIALPPGDTQQAREIYREMEQKLAFNPRARLGV